MPMMIVPKRHTLVKVILVLAWGPLWAWPGHSQSKPQTAPAAQKTLSPPPSFVQLRNSYLSQCDTGSPDANRTRFCACSFDRLIKRYTVEQYTLMDQLIRTSAPTVAEFASIAWAPEFGVCRNASLK